MTGQRSARERGFTRITGHADALGRSLRAFRRAPGHATGLANGLDAVK
jgi:hypothetical protein